MVIISSNSVTCSPVYICERFLKRYINFGTFLFYEDNTVMSIKAVKCIRIILDKRKTLATSPLSYTNQKGAFPLQVLTTVERTVVR